MEGNQMPRQARLDAPGTLHHVMIRGIEKRNIVDNQTDRKDFVTRLGHLAKDTNTGIFAWALLNNHAHILLRSSDAGISLFMRRMLTGYAISYNLRHKRHGHLFQNRYKSIVCDQDTYFIELVRYIHLNPLRANLVRTLTELDTYPWCGHSVLIGKRKNDWQDRDYVLKWFGDKEGTARKIYRDYVKKGSGDGRRPELVGGGLVRSLGGWSQVKSMRRAELSELHDDRILGSGDFVEQIIKEASQKVKYQFPKNEHLQEVEEFIMKMCQEENININEIRSGSRRKQISKFRSQLAVSLVEKYGISLAETARRLGVSTSAISKIMNR
jgi:REP element-mobilizing transposase RayT